MFSTIEQIDSQQALLIAKNGRLEPFSKDKLLISVYESLKHRKTAINDATALTNTIWGQLVPLAENATILREQVIEVSATVLEHFDQAAAVHYRAFHISR